MSPRKYARIAKILRNALPNLVAVYIYGSVAAGRERLDSDIDIAVLPAIDLSSEARHKIRLKLESELSQDVDLVDLRTADTVLAAQVISRGRVILDQDPHQRQVFEMYAYSDYARLNEERAPILDAIARSGRIHA